MKKRFISILSIAIMALICFSSCKKAEGNPETITLFSGSYRYISPEELQEIADLVFIGEYIGKIYLEVKRRPRFIVEEFLED